MKAPVKADILTSMKNLLPLFFLLAPLSISAQIRDNSFKIVASMTGLGAAYEFNPAGILYTEAGLTSSFRSGRANVQAKLALYNREDFKIKFGVEGAYLFGNFDVGSIYIDYDRFNNFVFMPVISFESRVVGIQIPLFVDRTMTYVYPIASITLNVSKDAPAKRVKKEKTKKDFDKDVKRRQKLQKKQQGEE
jgi:hypothetical protein